MNKHQIIKGAAVCGCMIAFVTGETAGHLCESCLRRKEYHVHEDNKEFVKTLNFRDGYAMETTSSVSGSVE